VHKDGKVDEHAGGKVEEAEWLGQDCILKNISLEGFLLCDRKTGQSEKVSAVLGPSNRTFH